MQIILAVEFVRKQADESPTLADKVPTDVRHWRISVGCTDSDCGLVERRDTQSPGALIRPFCGTGAGR